MRFQREKFRSFYDGIVKAIPILGTRHSYEEFERTYSLVYTRCFGIRDYNPNYTFLVPYADMLNSGTKSQVNAVWKYDKERNAMKFVSTKNIKKGEPVYTSI